MTIAEALDDLRAVLTTAERVLAERTDAGADLSERLALAGDAYAARLRVADFERIIPTSTQKHRGELFADTLADLLQR